MLVYNTLQYFTNLVWNGLDLFGYVWACVGSYKLSLDMRAALCSMIYQHISATQEATPGKLPESCSRGGQLIQKI